MEGPLNSNVPASAQTVWRLRQPFGSNFLQTVEDLCFLCGIPFNIHPPTRLVINDGRRGGEVVSGAILLSDRFTT